MVHALKLENCQIALPNTALQSNFLKKIPDLHDRYFNKFSPFNENTVTKF